MPKQPETKIDALTKMAKKLVALAGNDPTELGTLHEMLGQMARLGLRQPELPVPVPGEK